MQKGAALLCMMDNILFEHSTVKALLDKKIATGWLPTTCTAITMSLYSRTLSMKSTDAPR